MTNPNKRPALGQGLAALLGPDITDTFETETYNQSQSDNGHAINSLPLSQMRSGKYQPRRMFDETEIEMLAQSIRENGIIQPIVVRPIGENLYEILAGERRWRAADRAGLHEVPVIIRQAISDQQALEIALLENIQRQDLSPIEEAEGYQKLIREFGYTQEGIAQALGKSRPHVANTLRLLNLPTRIIDALGKKTISAGHARVLLGISASEAEALLETIIHKNLNVRQTERLVRNAQNYDASAPRAPSTREYKPDTIIELETIIQKVVNAPCVINEKNGKILLTVSFQDFDQLDTFLNSLVK